MAPNSAWIPDRSLTVSVGWSLPHSVTEMKGKTSVNSSVCTQSATFIVGKITLHVFGGNALMQSLHIFEHICAPSLNSDGKQTSKFKSNVQSVLTKERALCCAGTPALGLISVESQGSECSNALMNIWDRYSLYYTYRYLFSWYRFLFDKPSFKQLHMREEGCHLFKLSYI